MLIHWLSFFPMYYQFLFMVLKTSLLFLKNHIYCHLHLDNAQRYFSPLGVCVFISTNKVLEMLCRKFIKSFLQGFLPGLALKIFLFALPRALMIMSKVEGYVAKSTLERKAAAKYYYFMFVYVFL